MAVLIDRTNGPAIADICARHDHRPDALLEILHDTQNTFGYLPDSALIAIAEAINISRAEIHGVVSFYHDFQREAPARWTIQLCRAEACQAVGSEELAKYVEDKLKIKPGEKTANGAVGLSAVYCLGNCALGPAAMVDGALYGRVTSEKIDALLAQNGWEKA